MVIGGENMAKTKLNDEDRKRIVEERGYRLLKIGKYYE